MESQAGVSDLSGVGTQFTDQAQEANGARETGNIDGAGVDQSGLVDGFHA